MVFFPSAKINIGLNVIEKRKDGFHNIETIFYPIELFDVVEFIENTKNELNFTTTGEFFNTKNIDDNLIIKAYNLFLRDFNLPYLDIHLHKKIPVGAGLGGGSSNASFMLKALNEYFKLDLNSNNLLSYAQILGSDCSFFINNQTAFACEKGDELQNIELNLKGYYIAIINPGISINTTEAYYLISTGSQENSLINQIKFPVDEWKEVIFNDFEKVIFPKYPVIETIKRKLYSLGALYSAMSGTGSSVFGIFEEEIKIKNYFLDYFVWEAKL